MGQFQIAEENYKAYTFDRDNGHVDFVTKATLCNQFYEGIQWEEKIKRGLERQKKPALTINKTLATINNVLGEQINSRMDVSYKPFREGTEETASALSTVLLSIANANRLHWKESEVFEDGIITSRGFFDARMVFDKHMVGDVSIKVLNPKNVVIDADADQYDPETWKRVTVTKWMSLDEIEHTYGKGKAKNLRSASESGFEMGYDSIDDDGDSFAGETRSRNGDRPKGASRVRVIERQYRKMQSKRHFVDPATGDMRPVPSNWNKARVASTLQTMGWELIDRVTKRIRWTVSADATLLFDDWSPFEHFTVVPYFPYFRRGRTMGLVEHLISPQQMLNKTASQELHVVNSSANGGWKVKKGSLKNMDPDQLEQRGAETGIVLELDDPNDAQKIAPNQIPTGLDRLTYKMDEFIKEVSGVSDSSRGFDREDVAAKAIQAKQAAGSVNLAKPMDNLMRTRYLLARNLLSLIQTYYTEERVLQITGETPGAQSEDVVVNQVTPTGEVLNDLTVGTYDVVISTVPTRETFMDTQFEEAKALRELGINISDEHIIANSHLAKKNEIIESLRNDAETQRQAQLDQLELAEKQADVQGKQADAERKGAETQLAGARAQKTQVDAQKTAQDAQQPNTEAQNALGKYELEVMKLQMEMRLKEREQEMNAQLKREELRQNRMLKMAEAEERLQIEKDRANTQAWAGQAPAAQ